MTSLARRMSHEPPPPSRRRYDGVGGWAGGGEGGEHRRSRARVQRWSSGICWRYAADTREVCAGDTIQRGEALAGWASSWRMNGEGVMSTGYAYFNKDTQSVAVRGACG